MATQTHHFSSTSIAYATYDDETETLNVTFANGRLYTLPSVSPDVWQDFITAPSAGRFFNERLKGQY